MSLSHQNTKDELLDLEAHLTRKIILFFLLFLMFLFSSKKTFSSAVSDHHRLLSTPIY